MSKVWLHVVYKVSEQWVSLHGWMGFRETLPCARFAAECSVGISVNSLNTMNTLSCSNVCHIARNQKSKHCMRFWNINAWWWTESQPTNDIYKANHSTIYFFICINLMMQLEPACLPILYLLYVFNKDELSLSLVVLGANCPKNIRIEFWSATKTENKIPKTNNKVRRQGPKGPLKF